MYDWSTDGNDVMAVCNVLVCCPCHVFRWHSYFHPFFRALPCEMQMPGVGGGR